VQLAILTAVLAAIAAAEGGGGKVDGVLWRLAAILGAALAAPLAAFAAVHRLSRSSANEEQDQQAAARLEMVVLGLWLAAVMFILLVGQWPRIVRANWALAQWPLVDEIAILLPVIAPLVLIWAAMYRLERRGQNDEAPAMLLRTYLLLQARHHLALVLLPPLLVVGLIETIAALKIVQSVDTVWWFVVPQLAVVLIFMPLVVRQVWRTTPLVLQPLRGTLDEICRSRGTNVREILLWQTNGTMANAAVVGISRFLRYLLLTDALLCRLNDRQIAAVVRHELAHLRRWHLPLRLAMLLLPVLGWLAMKQAFPSVEPQPASATTALSVWSGQMAPAAVPVALFAYAVIVVGWYSRLLEHDADVDACLDEKGRFDKGASADFCSALMTLCSSSAESWFSRWLHPSLRARVELLNRIAVREEIASQMRRQTHAIAAVLVLFYVAVGVLTIVGS
jgi:STE24 endopeptidase